MSNLYQSITEIFKAGDDKHLQNSIEWAFKMKQKLNEFFDNTEDRVDFKVEFKALQEEFGSKVLFEAIRYSHTSEDIIAKITKIHNQTIEKRNKNIADKLAKANIKEVLGEKVSYTADGFHGVWEVETDHGVQVVKIQTIYAQGEVQRLHQRTLCNVTKK